MFVVLGGSYYVSCAAVDSALKRNHPALQTCNTWAHKEGKVWSCIIDESAGVSNINFGALDDGHIGQSMYFTGDLKFEVNF
jgi:hypothetical protein